MTTHAHTVRPTQLAIVVPYHDAARMTGVWADEEARIDFRHDADRATRCTVAFAAMELQRFLQRTLTNTSIAPSESPQHNAFNIVLRATSPTSSSDTFRLIVENDSLTIEGAGRIGVLLGAYEALRLQGWRWLTPDADGEIAPPPTDTLALPTSTHEFAPSMNVARGFDIEGATKESASLLLWMARNRMNLSGSRPHTSALSRKLGIVQKSGGHLFETILAPNRPMPSGRTLFEDHPEWYGTNPAIDKTPQLALRTQFCVSRPDLVAFLVDAMLDRLAHEWHTADRIDIWGFDTWGCICTCDDCRALGNAADQNLFFASAIRDAFNDARRDGRLDRDITIGLCAYEGTATLAGPTRPTPQNLIDAGDSVVFYPINRCYAHAIDDATCETNAHYWRHLQSWLTPTPHLPIVIGEYYNVSRFEDLPLVFAHRMADDMRAYHRVGVAGVTYMHVPLINWGLRALTQLLHAQLAWNIDTDIDAFLAEYFEHRYGTHADAMRGVYDDIESAFTHIAAWRAWRPDSILSQLQRWNVQRPAEPLAPAYHFANANDMLADGRRLVERLTHALDALKRVQSAHLTQLANHTATIAPQAVNPLEARQRENGNRTEFSLAEDRRLLKYGWEMMTLMTEMVALHDAMHRNDAATAARAERAIVDVAEKLDDYLMPITFDDNVIGLISRDALTRTQLRVQAQRIRGRQR